VVLELIRTSRHRINPDVVLSLCQILANVPRCSTPIRLGAGLEVVSDSNRTVCVCKTLKISDLRRGARGAGQPRIGGGATLKNFFAYFSASASYGFCDFQNMAQK